MADGIKAVEGLLTPLLPRDVMAVIRLHLAFWVVSCLNVPRMRFPWKRMLLHSASE
jgi:hypothetical protein